MQSLLGLTDPRVCLTESYLRRLIYDFGSAIYGPGGERLGAVLERALEVAPHISPTEEDEAIRARREARREVLAELHEFLESVLPARATVLRLDTGIWVPAQLVRAGKTFREYSMLPGAAPFRVTARSGIQELHLTRKG